MQHRSGIGEGGASAWPWRNGQASRHVAERSYACLCADSDVDGVITKQTRAWRVAPMRYLFIRQASRRQIGRMCPGAMRVAGPANAETRRVNAHRMK